VFDLIGNFSELLLLGRVPKSKRLGIVVMGFALWMPFRLGCHPINR